MENKKPLRRTVDDLLFRLGVKSSLSGFLYLGDALEMMIKSGLIRGRSGVMWLYAAISNERRASISTVERTMRYAVEDVFQHGNLDLITELFPREYEIAGKATVKEFLVRLACRIAENDLTFLGK